MLLINSLKNLNHKGWLLVVSHGTKLKFLQKLRCTEHQNYSELMFPEHQDRPNHWLLKRILFFSNWDKWFIPDSLEKKERDPRQQDFCVKTFSFYNWLLTAIFIPVKSSRQKVVIVITVNISLQCFKGYYFCNSLDDCDMKITLSLYISEMKTKNMPQ